MNTLSSMRPERLAQVGLGLLVLIGCWWVLRPFLPAILFSAAIVLSTWPAHRWLLRRLNGRRNTASLISCLVVALLVIVPTAVVVMSLRDALVWLLGLFEQWRSSGGWDVGAWLARLPVVGEHLRSWLADITATGGNNARTAAAMPFAEPARRLVMATVRILGNGVFQTLLAGMLLFFLYRDGERMARRLRQLAGWFAGAYGAGVLDTVQRTVVGVMISVIGTALAQSAVATLGFSIAGVPQPLLLGSITFAVSILPIGPPLIWGGATLWLMHRGEPGWALFMALYGIFGISLVDNVVKPLLISRSSRLPFAVTFMGLVGGVFAFGVAGVFIGPILLALAIHLARQYSQEQNQEGDMPGESQE